MLGPSTRAGTVSVTTTFRARDGPRLVPLTLPWHFFPGPPRFGSSALAILRSACREGDFGGAAHAAGEPEHH
ncbi:hypothetical protein VM98_34420 [Streptomyces rubellomurinus subsp. indigoferus]|nr:hypothetical protein VM98_34420 [Streptomyces rubellomurinus subsp. indigoferus]